MKAVSTGSVYDPGYEPGSPQALALAGGVPGPRKTVPASARTEEFGRPTVFQDWSPKDRGAHMEAVEVYSNCAEVELTLNGRSLGAKWRNADDSARKWTVGFEAGELKTVGKSDGKACAEETLRTAGKAAKLRLVVEGKSLGKGFDDVEYVRATVVDEQGTPVPDAGEMLRFAVEGPGVILATDGGDNADHSGFQKAERAAFSWECDCDSEGNEGQGNSGGSGERGRVGGGWREDESCALRSELQGLSTSQKRDVGTRIGKGALMRILVLAWVCGLGVAGAQSAPVKVADGDAAWVLSNAYVTATISKTTGDMVSLKYKNLETMGYVSGHHAGYWEQNPSGAKRLEARVTIDPATNAGERGEVSVKGWSDGESLTAHPRKDSAASVEDAASQLGGRMAGPPAGSGRMANAGTFTGNRQGGERGPGLLLDMEIRYALGREDHGIYTYAVFTHEPAYGATQLGESRYGFKLNGAGVRLAFGGRAAERHYAEWAGLGCGYGPEHEGSAAADDRRA